MKIKSLPVTLIACLTVILAACGGDDPTPANKTPEEIATERLTGTGFLTWAIANGGSVKKDQDEITDLYSAFELTMNSGSSQTYTAKSGGDLFDNTGNWSFSGNNYDKFTMTGTKPVAGREISFTRNGDVLRLEFTIPTPGTRINGVQVVAGAYVFILNKK